MLLPIHSCADSIGTGARAPTFTHGWHVGGGTVRAPWVEKQQTRNWANCTALTKTTNCTFRAKKVEGHDQNLFRRFAPDWCPPLSNSFRRHCLYSPKLASTVYPYQWRRMHGMDWGGYVHFHFYQRLILRLVQLVQFRWVFTGWVKWSVTFGAWLASLQNTEGQFDVSVGHPKAERFSASGSLRPLICPWTSLGALPIPIHRTHHVCPPHILDVATPMIINKL